MSDIFPEVFIYVASVVDVFVISDAVIVHRVILSSFPKQDVIFTAVQRIPDAEFFECSCKKIVAVMFISALHRYREIATGYLTMFVYNIISPC